MSHPEAVYPSTSCSQWALVVHGANGKSSVIASSFGVSMDVDMLGPDPEDIGLPIEMDGPGFYLWKGLQNFDGLDGVDYSDGKTEKIDPITAVGWMSNHESEPHK